MVDHSPDPNGTDCHTLLAISPTIIATTVRHLIFLTRPEPFPKLPAIIGCSGAVKITQPFHRVHAGYAWTQDSINRADGM